MYAKSIWKIYALGTTKWNYSKYVMYYVCNIRIKREILEIITNEKGEKRNMNKVGVVSLVAVRERERERAIL